MTIGLSLTVVSELVKHKKDDSITLSVTVGDLVNIPLWVGNVVSVEVVTLIRTLPGDAEVVETQHLISLESQFIDVLSHSFGRAICPVRVTANMTFEDVSPQEIA